MIYERVFFWMPSFIFICLLVAFDVCGVCCNDLCTKKRSCEFWVVAPLGFLNLFYSSLSRRQFPAFIAIAASIEAMVARLNISLTGDSTEMKWTGLLRPI